MSRESGITRFGYLAHGGDAAVDMANEPEGGFAFVAKATVALNIGDTVILHTTAGEVTKDATTGLHYKRVGIVVGGTLTGMRCLTESDAVGKAAAGAGQQVLVCYSGIAWAISQVNDIAIGDKLKPDTTTAGRVIDGTDTTDLVAGITGRIVGSALTATTAVGQAVKVLVSLG